MNSRCPKCRRRINTVGVGWCPDCLVYTDWKPVASKHPPSSHPDDPRSEKEIQHAVRLRWEFHGWTVCDMSQSRATQQVLGFPDILALSGDRSGLVMCEVKSAKGRQSQYQKEFEAICETAGVPYIVVRHEDDVSEYLRRDAA